MQMHGTGDALGAFSWPSTRGLPARYCERLEELRASCNDMLTKAHELTALHVSELVNAQARYRIGGASEAWEEPPRQINGVDMSLDDGFQLIAKEVHLAGEITMGDIMRPCGSRKANVALPLPKRISGVESSQDLCPQVSVVPSELGLVLSPSCASSECKLFPRQISPFPPACRESPAQPLVQSRCVRFAEFQQRDMARTASDGLRAAAVKQMPSLPIAVSDGNTDVSDEAAAGERVDRVSSQFLTSYSMSPVYVVAKCFQDAKASCDDCETAAGSTDMETNLSRIRSAERVSDSFRVGVLSSISSAIFDARWSLREYFCHPASPVKLIWEFAGAVLLLYDVVMLPMQAFEIPDNALMNAMTWATFMYWSADIAANFFSGYYEAEGKVVMNLKLIWIKYAKSWLFPDIFLVGIEWTLCISKLSSGTKLHNLMQHSEEDDVQQAGGGNMAIFRVGKFLRLLRFLRLIRVMKFTHSSFIFVLQDTIESELVYTLTNLLKNLLVVIGLNHFIACFWFAVGKLEMKGYGNWTTVYKVDAHPWYWGYLVSVHWSLAQFANGEILVEPQNIPERCTSIFVLLLSIVVFSSFIAVVGNTVTKVIEQKGSLKKNRFVLRLYLRQHNISLPLRLRVHHFVGFVTSGEKKRLHHKDVKFFGILSRPLQMELLTELYAKLLVIHPFFDLLAIYNHNIVRNLCATAVKQTQLSRGDILFGSGEEAHSMYVVTCGVLNYVPSHSSNCAQAITSDEWFCEAALWTSRWQTTGRMSATTECDLIAIEAESFQNCVTRHTASNLRFTCGYATAFVDRLNNIKEAGADLSDFQTNMMSSEQIEGVLSAWLCPGNDMGDSIPMHKFTSNKVRQLARNRGTTVSAGSRRTVSSGTPRRWH